MKKYKTLFLLVGILVTTLFVNAQQATTTRVTANVNQTNAGQKPAKGKTEATDATLIPGPWQTQAHKPVAHAVAPTGQVTKEPLVTPSKAPKKP